MKSKKKLGKTGLEILPLALGGNVFGWTADEATSFKILDQFVHAGGTLIDTADVYSGFAPGGKYGESERIIGKWMKSRNNRQGLIIATKVGYPMSAEKKGLSRRYLQQSIDESLQRLQTDYVDLYQSHRDDLETPVTETLDAYAGLIAAGKVRFIGASQTTPERFERTFAIAEDHSLVSYATLQPLYNLYERKSYEEGFEKICAKYELGVMTYYSVARGFLTGKYRTEADLSQSVRGKDIAGYLNPRGFRILNALHSAAKELNATPAQIALAWLMHQPTVTAAIASATDTDQLTDLLGSIPLDLPAELRGILDTASRYDI